MATRMQQRRGTAQQWTDADPILAAGEIGFETDTNQFKIGDGVNNWSDLSYFKNLEDLGGSLDDYVPVTTKGQVNGVAELDSTGNVPLSQLGNLIDGAPEALNTLNEIAASINDDTNFVAYVTAQLGNKANLISPTLLGAPLAPTATLTDNSTKIATTAFVKGQAYGLAVDISNLDTRMDAAEGDVTALETTTSGLTSDMTTAQNDIDSLTTTTSTHTSSISTIGGQITTLQSDLDAAELDIDNLESSVTAVEASVSTLETLTTGHTASIGTIESDITAAQTDITAIQSDLTTAEGSIATLQGDLDTAEATLSTTTSNFNAHDVKTTNVHGIADTAALATKTYADTAGTNAIASANTYADSAVASKAPLASPALTGTPTAPTATVGTNTTQIATTAFVKAEVDAVIAAAPGALNTLDELAAALGDDANYATTVTNALALKAPLAGPTFTGTVALPAASSVTLDGTALSTTLATKADKTADIASKSGAYTFVTGDVNMILEFNSASGANFTIPADNSFWPVGQRLEVLQVAGGQVTIVGGSGVTVNGTPTAKTRTQWSGATVIKRAANTFVVLGDLASS
jgi:peptidoglycan hydrolase CwlO-like protein